MKFSLLFVFTCLCTFTYGQFTEPKIGKVELSDLKMTSYDKDTSAAALILFDNGVSEFEMNSKGEFQHRYKRHLMIKIFKKSALSLADMVVVLHKYGEKEELFSNLDAASYNLVDGKIVKTVLDNQNIFNEHEKYRTIKKFAIPVVKEGTVFEISYTITSDFLYNFRGWRFQYDYPARWSQYTYTIPEYLEYRPLFTGYLKFDVQTNAPGFAYYLQNNGLTTKTTETTLAIKNVPSFISEPNIDCEDNYIQSIEFELSSVQYPGSIRKDYARTWESINTEMMDDENFGFRLKTNNNFEDTVAILCRDKISNLEKANSIYAYVQNRMEWNSTYSIWAFDPLKKAFNEQIGNSCEINLILTDMLRTAGLTANPVLFSTRKNGLIKTFSPSIYAFNSVLSSVEIDGKVYLLDATNKLCPFGVLPPENINGKGRVVNVLQGKWVDLETNQIYLVIKSYKLDISISGVFSGTIFGRYDGYAGYKYRSLLGQVKTTDDFIRQIQENESGLTVKSYSILNWENIYLPVTDTLRVEIADHIEVLGDKIIFNPLLMEAVSRNPYTLEERNYPIDYNYLVSENFIFEYTIPDGYAVEAMPKSGALKTADNSISVLYAIQNVDNSIKVVYRKIINRKLFLPDEYLDLKDFYDEMVKMNTEMIILKKIN
jgi:hypothetical protein